MDPINKRSVLFRLPNESRWRVGRLDEEGWIVFKSGLSGSLASVKDSIVLYKKYTPFLWSLRP